MDGFLSYFRKSSRYGSAFPSTVQQTANLCELHIVTHSRSPCGPLSKTPLQQHPAGKLVPANDPCGRLPLAPLAPWALVWQ